MFPVLLLGAALWLVLFLGQALVLMLSETTKLRARVVRPLGYWAFVAGLLVLASTVPALRQAVLLPMLLVAALPVHAIEWLVQSLCL